MEVLVFFYCSLCGSLAHSCCLGPSSTRSIELLAQRGTICERRQIFLHFHQKILPIEKNTCQKFFRKCSFPHFVEHQLHSSSECSIHSLQWECFSQKSFIILGVVPCSSEKIITVFTWQSWSLWHLNCISMLSSVRVVGSRHEKKGGLLFSFTTILGALWSNPTNELKIFTLSVS